MKNGRKIKDGRKIRKKEEEYGRMKNFIGCREIVSTSPLPLCICSALSPSRFIYSSQFPTDSRLFLPLRLYAFSWTFHLLV